jgi:GNAT superfamily N-acetyltransferase
MATMKNKAIGVMATLKSMTPKSQSPLARDRPALVLRLAGLEDLASVLSVYTAAGQGVPALTDAAQARQTWSRLTAAGGEVWLAEYEGQPVGTLTLYLLPLLVHGGVVAAVADGLAVHPSAHHHRVGRALINRATERARAMGAFKLAVAPPLTRKGAKGLIERLVYAQHGRSRLLPELNAEP